MKLMRFGDGDEGKIIDNVTISGTTAVISTPAQIRDTNGISLVLLSDANAGQVDPVTFLPVALAGTVDGTWQVLVSNDYVPNNGGTVYGSPANAGHWTDITSQFTPAIATVAHGTQATTAQYVQASPLDARTLIVVFRPSAGAGKVSVHAYAKSQG